MNHNQTQPSGKGLSSSALFGTSLADCNDIEKLRTIAEKLWSLLDDIDTASDMFKPSDLAGYKQFYGYSMKKSADRGKQLESDGYHLYLPNTEI